MSYIPVTEKEVICAAPHNPTWNVTGHAWCKDVCIPQTNTASTSKALGGGGLKKKRKREKKHLLKSYSILLGNRAR